ncbi:unnamed protein product [Arabis nemorensis]|uniref:Uncharacterized protein n=1 Tax=Arabis nemorensis TaxID=586526 RepID=A0A565AX91_9BRAS|nr:unnamed protein product [Arabis nemorensis]
MKKLGRKGTVHPSPEIKSDDHFLSLLPVAILSLVAALSPEDREVLAYLISNCSFSEDPNRISRLKKKKALDHHSPLFLCDCFSCYTSYWVRWDSSPSRQVIHEIIEAFEDSLEMKKKNNNSEQKSNTGKKDRRKRSGKANAGVTSRLSELGSSSTELVSGDSVENGSCGGEETEKGSVEKIMSFIGQRFFGVWG